MSEASTSYRPLSAQHLVGVQVLVLDGDVRVHSGIAQLLSEAQLHVTSVHEAEAAVARRVIAPRDYLPADFDPQQGFAPNSEQSARLVFSLAQAKAAGFRVYLFYP